MSRLEELIAEFCPDGVEYIAREQVLREKIAKTIVKSEVG